MRRINALEDLFWKLVWKIVPETQGNKYDLRIINALEDLVWWQESLANTSLEKANLPQIQLPKANLTSANLNSANLTSANLNYANLFLVNLTSANLNYSNLTSANLYSADLNYANLTSANFTNANLIEAKNLTNTQIKMACFWDQAIYKGDYDQQKDKWITDEKANQEFIARLKQDKASDPEVKPDCRMCEK